MGNERSYYDVSDEPKDKRLNEEVMRRRNISEAFIEPKDVCSAISTLKSQEGSSFSEIKKYLVSQHDQLRVVPARLLNSAIKSAMSKSLINGTISRGKGTSRFMLNNGVPYTKKQRTGIVRKRPVRQRKPNKRQPTKSRSRSKRSKRQTSRGIIRGRTSSKRRRTSPGCSVGFRDLHEKTLLSKYNRQPNSVRSRSIGGPKGSRRPRGKGRPPGKRRIGSRTPTRSSRSERKKTQGNKSGYSWLWEKFLGSGKPPRRRYERQKRKPRRMSRKGKGRGAR